MDEYNRTSDTYDNISYKDMQVPPIGMWSSFLYHSFQLPHAVRIIINY